MAYIPNENLPLISFMSEEAAKLGIRLYAVGGCVRDWLLGLPVHDIDFLASGPAEGLAEAVCGRYGGKWQRFGTFQTLRCMTEMVGRVDIARFRKETYSRPAALPETVPADSLEQDLLRRDFTINAMAADLRGISVSNTSVLITDIFNGRKDIESGIIRILHKDSFRDDPTRIYRAARFAARFGWRLSPETEELAAKACKDGIPGLLSRERLRNELFKILDEENATAALKIAAYTGAMDFIYPGLNGMKEKFDNILSSASANENEEDKALCRAAALAQSLGENSLDFIFSLRLSKKQSRIIASLAGTEWKRRSEKHGKK